MFKRLVLGALSLGFAATSVLAFGYTTSGNSIIVTTDAGLTFTVDKSTGDITSLIFNGIETQDQGSKKSQIASGIGATCSVTQSGDFIKITCNTSTITHYYVAKNKDPAVHMATYTTEEPSVGELRYIARLKKTAVPDGYGVSEMAAGTAIEGSDVFLVGNETRSKFYSSKHFIDDKVHGVTGSGVGVYMIIPEVGYEGASGGPFFRDINDQGSTQQELYYYMNSNHTQTEAYRMGLHGPYALWFTTGAAPSTYDTSFWESLDITGLVTRAQRGRVTGKTSGVPSAFANSQVVTFSNSAAQYWVKTDSAGAFTSDYMKPGTYTMSLHKSELVVASQSITVTAGGLVTSNIASTEASPTAIWQIGEFDGTPSGFLNADKIEIMHPSDARMASWGPITFTVGSSIQSFPMALFKAFNPLTIKFTLTASQIGARTLEIGTTLAFAGGRPQATVNSWTGPAPAAPTIPASRGVTRGTWRGVNTLYTVDIPSGVLVAGSNTITINSISASSGDKYLSPNFVFDALRLY